MAFFRRHRLQGHFDDVYSMVMFPGGDKVITGSDDFRAVIWSVETGKPLRELKHDTGVWSVDVFPAGDKVVTGSDDPKGRIWNAETGDKVRELRGHDGPVWKVTVFPDGDRVVTGGEDRKAIIFNAVSGHKLHVLQAQDGGIWSLAVFAGGDKVITGGEDNFSTVWNARNGSKLLELRGHTSKVLSLAVFPAGDKVITGSEDAKAIIWKTSTGVKSQKLAGHTGTIFCVAVLPDGQRVVTASADKTAVIWDAISGVQLRTLAGHAEAISFVSVFAGGECLVTGGEDTAAIIWDVASGKQLHELVGHRDAISAIAVTATGSRVVTASSDCSTMIWEQRSDLVNVSSLTKVAKDDDGLLGQPDDPKFRTALVQIYVPSQERGGSDKLKNGHRFDSVPIANGMIKSGMSCQLLHYVPEEHDQFFKVLAQFDAVLVRCNPGHITAAGGDQNKFDIAMMNLAERVPVWPTADTMASMGAKDALCSIKHMDFGLPDTLGYYSPNDIRAGFPKTIAFQPRVVKQNRGSAGEGIWIIKLKSGDYCRSYGDRVCSDSETLVLTEANDNHVEEHTVGEFIEFCVNGRTDKSGDWASIGIGGYFEGGKKAGGQMVDQRFLPRIEEGEARFMMVGTELYRIEHYVYEGGVGGEIKTRIYPPDAPEYAATRQKLEQEVPEIMKTLGLSMSKLPLLWAADFIPVDNHPTPLVVGEFNCSCLGIAGFLNARGKDLSVLSKEDVEVGQKMCDLIGAKALGQLKLGPIDVGSLTRIAKNNDGLLDQPKKPKFRTALVQIYVPSQEMGGSDKLTNGHRFDSIPIANGMIKSRMSCQLLHYVPEEHDEFFRVLSKFDGVLLRCNPAHITAAGGDQNKFDAAMSKLAERILVWPTSFAPMEECEIGQQMCDLIGAKAFQSLRTHTMSRIGFPTPGVLKVVFLRHGESDWNVKNIFTGWTDVDLSENGKKEALEAGKMLKAANIRVNFCFTSVLRRTIRTAWTALMESGNFSQPVIPHWRLNERHYGNLQGLSKSETARKHGEKQVKLWRRSYDVPPPSISRSDNRHPCNDPLYKSVSQEVLPGAESLKDTEDRVMPYWHDTIAPCVMAGRTVLVAAHGNSLRAICKYLEKITPDEVLDLNIPTGIPLVYELTPKMQFIRKYYLMDEEDVAKKMAAVANQGKAK